MDTIDFRTRYGASETNGLTDPEAEVRRVDRTRIYQLSDKAVTRIVRVRLISDRGNPLWDLSYCWGELRDGTRVSVDLGRFHFPKHGLSAALVDTARQAGRYAKGIGLLDAVSLCQ